MYKTLSKNSATTLITQDITECRRVLYDILTIIKASISTCT